MLTVHPHAGELASGHMGRLKWINTFPDKLPYREAMRTQFEQSGLGSRNTPLLHILASLSSMEVRSYERLHSMLPFMAFAVRETLRTSDGGWGPSLVGSGLMTPRESAYLCPACVNEDKRHLGYSYWRRSHQLPSSFWCDEHPTERLHAAREGKPFDRLPQHFLEAGKTEPQSFPEDLRDHPVLRGFEQACQSMLNAGSSHAVKVVRRMLRRQAHQRGITTRCQYIDRVNGVRFSDVARKTVPVDLLQALFPSFLGKAPGTFYVEIDDAVRLSGLNPLATGTALAISLLSPSISEALLEITQVSKTEHNEVSQLRVVR